MLGAAQSGMSAPSGARLPRVLVPVAFRCRTGLPTSHRAARSLWHAGLAGAFKSKLAPQHARANHEAKACFRPRARDHALIARRAERGAVLRCKDMGRTIYQWCGFI